MERSGSESGRGDRLRAIEERNQLADAERKLELATAAHAQLAAIVEAERRRRRTPPKPEIITTELRSVDIETVKKVIARDYLNTEALANKYRTDQIADVIATDGVARKLARFRDHAVNDRIRDSLQHTLDDRVHQRLAVDDRPRARELHDALDQTRMLLRRIEDAWKRLVALGNRGTRTIDIVPGRKETAFDRVTRLEISLDAHARSRLTQDREPDRERARSRGGGM